LPGDCPGGWQPSSRSPVRVKSTGALRGRQRNRSREGIRVADMRPKLIRTTTLNNGSLPRRPLVDVSAARFRAKRHVLAQSLVRGNGTRFAQVRARTSRLLLMVSNAFDTQPTLAAAATVTQPEPAAYDRPLRVGVLPDINAAPFLSLSLVIVDASDDPAPATWREWSARQRAEGLPAGHATPPSPRDGMNR
jgi:hypothetical protein